ncbi:MAG: LTA synthase family protein [Myxococcales bacterium]|nr:LTA synthase family protein [Myxococcales bacterium]
MTSLLRFLAASLLIQWTLLGALRVVFWWVFRDPLDPIPTASIAKAFYLGAKFDLRLCLLLHLPIALAGLVPRWNPGRHPRPRNWAIGYLAAAAAGLLLVHGFDGGHYEYLASRLDASSLRFLHNPYESFGVLWESYPVLLGSLAVLVVGTTYGWLLRSALPAGSEPHSGRRAELLAAIATVLLFAGGIYGKLSYYPLRWSDAFFSTHEFASSLALNPTLYFLDTFKNRSVEYDVHEARSYYPHISRYLGVPDPDAKTLKYARALSPNTDHKPRPNVVIVLLESLAYYKTGFSGNALDPSPHLDRIAREGQLYTRFYAPHGGTARAVFAAFTGLPDVEPSKTSTRNPLIVEQHTLFNAFANYEKFYFLGGSASWANIRALLRHNIPGARIYEEGDYAAPRVDVWGISDLHLFEEANRVLRGVDEPFIAFIHTAGNHKPFSIPEDSRGFEPSKLSDEAVIPHGFDSVAELDGMRLMDHSLGWFFETARQEAYFDNTIFALFGDHGSPAPTLHRPPGEDQLRLSRYHVPLIVYGPALVPPGQSDVIGSTVDILPTLVELAGADGTATTLGRSLASPDDEPRFAFTITGQGHLPRLGLVGEEHYFTVYEDGSEPLLHRIYADEPRKDRSDEEPERAAEFLHHTLAIYETVKYMRYHNVARDQSESSPTTASGSE